MLAVYDNNEKDRKLNGLPAIFHKKRYIVFSPHNKKIIVLKEVQLKDSNVLDYLSKLNFFEEKSKDNEDRLAITLYLTPNCNMDCIYCFDNKNCKLTERMSPEKAVEFIKVIIKNCKEYGLKYNGKLNIHFFGGEPTLEFKTIKAVVEFIEDNKIDPIYWISTNGVTKEENLDYMIEKGFKFNICCDGPPHIHDKNRPLKVIKGKKSSDYVESIIKKLIKSKSKIRTKVVITNETMKDMPVIVEYLANLGIQHIRLEPVLIDGRAKRSKLKSVDPRKFVYYFLKALDKVYAINKETKKNVYLTNWATRNLFEPRDHFCKVVRGNRIALTPKGNITKCVRNLHSGDESPFVVGQINDQRLNLNKDKIKILKNLSVEGISKCKNCFAKYVCSGGCFNENFYIGGSFKEIYENKCELSRLLLRNLIIKMYQHSNA